MWWWKMPGAVVWEMKEVGETGRKNARKWIFGRAIHCLGLCDIEFSDCLIK